MVTRNQSGKEYKLVASTDKRVGAVLLAISRVDMRLEQVKRPRIKKIKTAIKVAPEYMGFNLGVAKFIREFKAKNIKV